METMIHRVRQMLAFGLSKESIRDQLIGEVDDDTIFLVYVAATIIEEATDGTV